MIASGKKEIKIMLVMDQAEATWLKAIMQNPINVDLHEESPVDEDMRKKFFEELESVLENLQ